MERIAVVSSNISSIGYSLNEEALEVEFKSGMVYMYWGVPENVYLELMSAPSKGSYLAQNIKNHFTYERIS